MDYQNSRGKKKNSRKDVKKKAPASNSSDDKNGYDSDDCESITSVASSVESHMFDELTSEDAIDLHEDFEAKLMDNIEDGARQKNSKSRQLSLTEIKKALCRRYIYDFITGRKESILDFSEKLLKKGNQEDRNLSSGIVSALCIQLGEGESTQVFTTVKPILISLIADASVSPIARASAASALGICCFIGSEELEDTADCLVALKAAFSKKIPSESSLHCAFASALSAWGLLLTIASSSVAMEQMEGCIATMCKLLELGDLNLRIAAGETVALVYELGRNEGVSFQGPVNTLYALLRDLANESGRHKGKREKKQQKSSFRDILKSVEKNIRPDEKIKFASEYIQMTSWTWICRYKGFKDVLGSGTITHLECNMLLRDIFELGLPATKALKESKNSKYERQLMNAAVSKTRTQKRNLRRDNKTSTVNI